jgi:hypothetical protein
MCRSRSIKAIIVFVGLLGLFWTREIVRESLAPEVLLLLCQEILVCNNGPYGEIGINL